MPSLGENPSETPILDNLLFNFYTNVGIEMRIRREETQRVIRQIEPKAKQKTLTKEDIEKALQDIIEVTPGSSFSSSFQEDQQIYLLTYLAHNYPTAFIKATGHNPFRK